MSLSVRDSPRGTRDVHEGRVGEGGQARPMLACRAAVCKPGVAAEPPPESTRAGAVLAAPGGIGLTDRSYPARTHYLLCPQVPAIRGGRGAGRTSVTLAVSRRLSPRYHPPKGAHPPTHPHPSLSTHPKTSRIPPRYRRDDERKPTSSNKDLWLSPRCPHAVLWDTVDRCPRCPRTPT